MTAADIVLYAGIVVAIGNVLAEVAKRFGWTRIQWFVEAVTPLAMVAAGRAASAPKDAAEIDSMAKAVVAMRAALPTTATNDAMLGKVIVDTVIKSGEDIH